MALLITVCVFILLCSFLASSMEAALFTVTPLQIERMVAKKLPGANLLKANKDRIHDSIIGVVILNNIANIAGSILVGKIASDLLEEVWLGVFSGALTFVIILAGEVIPKTIGERHAVTYARLTAPLVNIFRIIFLPVVGMLKILSKPLGGSTESRDRTSEEEITLLASLGHQHGVIDPGEHQMIQQVFKLNDILAKDIMTPRTVVFALQADRPIGEVSKELYQASVSRIPLYGTDLDDIVGLVHIRDLLSALSREEKTRPLRAFADEVMYVPDTSRADVLLRSFQQNREHFAIVVDEYGGTAGVLTLEDILEQLVGEIVDEFDRDVDMRVKARVQKERRETS